MTPTGFVGHYITPCDFYYLSQFEKASGAKTGANSQNSPLSDTDQQALDAFISYWSEITHDNKIDILQLMEADTVGQHR